MASSKEINPSFLKKLIKNIFFLFGFELRRKNNFLDRKRDHIPEASDQENKELVKFEKICLASKLNLWSIFQSIKYISDNKISGDIVECGVYNGNTLSLLGRLIKKHNLNKKIWGYDTFEKGFLKENLSKFDINFKNNKITELDNDDTHYFKISEVISNINEQDNYDTNNYKLIQGDIIKTLDDEENIPEKISFLRMDTDLYATTKKQLEILYPRLSIGGVLHIDDFGMAPGVQKAVEDYFGTEKIWLHRVDLSCRYMIKKK